MNVEICSQEPKCWDVMPPEFQQHSTEIQEILKGQNTAPTKGRDQHGRMANPKIGEKQKVSWEWLRNPNDWTPYEQSCQSQIEEAYVAQNGKGEMLLNVGKFSVTINFDDMIQKSSRVRKIRRIGPAQPSEVSVPVGSTGVVGKVVGKVVGVAGQVAANGVKWVAQQMGIITSQCSDPPSTCYGKYRDLTHPHWREYAHVCRFGKSCNNLSDPKHSEYFIHLDLPSCPSGRECLALDPKHRESNHHPGWPDVMLQCEWKGGCKKTSDLKHMRGYKH